ncbi:MAG TPA: C13 family peptidase [Rhizomicrobium sp.]
MRLVVFLFALLLAVPAAAADFSNWAAIVVAGDHRAHDGGDSEVFDNGRHDIGAALQRIGFKPENILEFSTEPQNYRGPAPIHSDPDSVAGALWDLSNRATGGCLLYLTSHGSPDGIVLGNDMLSPKDLSRMVNNSCGDRPTAIVVSSCFSGVFIPALAAADRFVLTAARPDRTSFGCGQADRYTFFDECFLSSIAMTHDFRDLAIEARRCVAAREKKENVSPPSDPQAALGDDLPSFPTW